MQTIADGAERERLLAILDFWHKIEFFIPYDLSSRIVSGEGRAVFWLHAKTLGDDGAALSRPAIPEEKQITGFTLFLGVFNKSEIADIRRHFDSVTADIAEYDDAERGDLDGDTCFASLQLSPWESRCSKHFPFPRFHWLWDGCGNPASPRSATRHLPTASGSSRNCFKTFGLNGI